MKSTGHLKYKNFVSILVLLSLTIIFNTRADEHILKSRILKKNTFESEELELNKNKSKDSAVNENKQKITKPDKDHHSNIKTKKKLEEPSKISEEKNIYKILYLKDKNEPDNDSFQNFQKALINIDRKNKVIIRSYSSINEKKTTSDARRLSLSRALTIRKFLIENNFIKTNVLVKAMGAKKSNQISQDIILIEIN